MTEETQPNSPSANQVQNLGSDKQEETAPISHTNQSLPVDKDNQIKELLSIIENYNFLTNQVGYNATMYNGFKIMLQKQQDIENKLIQLESKINALLPK